MIFHSFCFHIINLLKPFYENTNPDLGDNRFISGLMYQQTEAKPNSILKKASENYTGPIIDMHVHAYGQPNPMFGLENYNPLTKKTYVGSETLKKHQEETFAKFKKHNIVSAMVSNGSEWHKMDSSLVIIGESHGNTIAELKEKHKNGKLKVLGEVAPNYQGLLPTDESIAPYFDLANELKIPIAYHMYPGGPPGGAYFAYPKTRAFQGKPLQLEEILFSRPKISQTTTTCIHQNQTGATSTPWSSQ